MRHGHLRAELSGDELTADRLARASYGTTSDDRETEVAS
jgi:hypothetical protein